jgi:hypothetical protein
MRWKFRRPKQTAEVKPSDSDWSDVFFSKPTAGNAKRIAAEMAATPTKDWPTVAVLGRYIGGYENRFKRAWPAGPVALQSALRGVASLVQREGAETACAAIDAVFSQHLRWVNGDLLGFLLHETNYVRFVIPAMSRVEETRRKQAGEQSEWSGPRSETSAYEEIIL